MPVRLLSSPVLKWPDFETVDAAVREWAKHVSTFRRDILRIGYYGSYARGNWGVGSDLDLIVVFEGRTKVSLDTTSLPVPVDLLVYSQDEWNSLQKSGRFAEVLQKELIWIFVR